MVYYPVRSIFSIPFQGLNKDGIPTFLNQDGQITTTDINFQESKKLDFLKYSGAAAPTDLGSFGNTFGYKLIHHLFIRQRGVSGQCFQFQLFRPHRYSKRIQKPLDGAGRRKVY